MPALRSLAPPLLAGALLAVAAPAAAGAETRSSLSANWAGYAVSRAGTSFRHVSGSWVQPKVSCTPGEETFSAFWVGIGGVSNSSQALEQIGTEADCTATGRERSIAWLELVPAPSKTIRMTVRPGDRMAASVTVSGRQVRLKIADRTRGTAFARTLTARRVDTGSAEWIAEAPSLCIASRCVIAPLADFGTVTFSHAGAQNQSGHSGSITDRRWSATRISLVDSTTFGPGPAATATPSATSAGGTRFKVRYRTAGAAASSARALRRYPG